MHDVNWLPVAHASRAMTSSERNYAQIEETLAIVFSTQRFHEHLYGLRFGQIINLSNQYLENQL